MRQTDDGVTARDTAPPEGAVAVKTNVESIDRSLIVLGEITGSFAESADAASTRCGDVATVFSLSPTRFVAETLTVYEVPPASPVKSAAAVVTVLRWAVISLPVLS
jgi:hypothetical protein